jgi:hypothetical protein
LQIYWILTPTTVRFTSKKILSVCQLSLVLKEKDNVLLVLEDFDLEENLKDVSKNKNSKWRWNPRWR